MTKEEFLRINPILYNLVVLGKFVEISYKHVPNQDIRSSARLQCCVIVEGHVTSRPFWSLAVEHRERVTDSTAEQWEIRTSVTYSLLGATITVPLTAWLFPDIQMGVMRVTQP